MEILLDRGEDPHSGTEDIPTDPFLRASEIREDKLQLRESEAFRSIVRSGLSVCFPASPVCLRQTSPCASTTGSTSMRRTCWRGDDRCVGPLRTRCCLGVLRSNPSKVSAGRPRCRRRQRGRRRSCRQRRRPVKKRNEK